MKEKNDIKGISVSAVAKLAAVLLVVFLVGIVIIVVEIISTNDKVSAATRDYNMCVDAIVDIRNSSYYLSDECRQFVENENYTHLYNYFYELDTEKRADNAVNVLNQNNINLADEDFITAMKMSKELQNHEIYAMKLILIANGYNEDDAKTPPLIKNCKLTDYELALSPEILRDTARHEISSSVYLNQQDILTSSIDDFRSTITENLSNELESTSKQHVLMIEIMIVIVVGLFSVIFGFIIILGDSIFKPISIYLHCISEGIRMPMRGAVEIQKLAQTYNNMLEKKDISRRAAKYEGKRVRVTGAVNNFGFNENIYDISQEMRDAALIYIEIDEFDEVKRFKSQSSINILNIELYNMICMIANSKDDIFELEEGLFAIFIFDVTSESISYIEDEFSKLHYRIQTTDVTLDITVSAGVAFTDISGYNVSLMNNANVALYKAKDRGGDCIMFYDKK